ncbi:MAG: radical SAM family heme chaperone HemW [Proteobacteria bacterium]|nr:radical SAM family heme chaperone HemW [Pseudomonadota bacterium]MBU1716112.1 radical SAM family heme chaperone HemW [Pseudomonadota bacterium]
MRPTDLDHNQQAGIYIHIPYCRSKCDYCSFNSLAVHGHDLNAYLAALTRQAERMANYHWTREQSFSTLFIGGGTPTILGGKPLAGLIKKILELFNFCPEPEITVETNPNTIAADTLPRLKEAGVNRLSIGIQSFSDQILKEISRTHTGAEGQQAVELARQAGFDNINLDLIYGLPAQDLCAMESSLATAMDLAPQHLSIYELMLEEGTPLADRAKQNRLQLPSEDEIADMELMIAEKTSVHGFARYEISNFAKNNMRCTHNINYWKNGPYLGLGAGAIAGIAGMRIANISDPTIYIKAVNAGEEPFSWAEYLTPAARFRETVIMGLRMMEGISITGLQKRFDIDLFNYYGDILDILRKKDLIIIEDDNLRLTTNGLPLANQVLRELV